KKRVSIHTKPKSSFIYLIITNIRMCIGVIVFFCPLQLLHLHPGHMWGCRGEGVINVRWLYKHGCIAPEAIHKYFHGLFWYIHFTSPYFYRTLIICASTCQAL